MTLIISIQINITLNLVCSTAWDNHNPASHFYPVGKFLTFIPFVCKYQFAIQVKFFKKLFCKANIITIAAR